MKTLAILFTLFYFLNALAVAPYGIKGQNQNVTYPNVYQYPNYSVTGLGGINALIETGNKNILENPSYEAPFFGSAPPSWASLGMTFNTSALPLSGQKAVRVSMSSSAMAFAQDSGVSQAAFAGGIQCLAMVYVKTTVSGIFVSSRQNSVTSTTNRVAVNNDGKYGLYKVPFICGSGSNGISIHSDGVAVTGDVDVDDSFVGAVNLQVSTDSSRVAGSSYFPATTGSNLTRTSTTLGAFTAVAAFPAPIVTSSSLGTWSTTDSNLPIQTIDNLPAGKYKATFEFGAATTLLANSAFAINDGTTTCESSAGASATSVSAKTVSCVFTYSTTGTRSFQLFAATSSNSIVLSNDDTPSRSNTKFFLEYFASDSTYTSNNADTDWAACSFSTLAWQGLGTVTNTLMCKRQGSDLLMMGAFTSGTATTSLMQIPLPTWNNSSLTIKALSYSGANTVGTGYLGTPFSNTYKEGNIIAGSGLNYLSIGGIFDTSTQNPLAPMAGNAFIGNSTVLTLFARIPINGWEQSNIIIGSFNGLQTCTDTLACTDTFSARVNTAGVVSEENVNWISGNATIATNYSLTYTSIGLTQPLNCTATADNVGRSVRVLTTSSTSVVVTVFNTLSQTATVDTGFWIVCQKQGADYIGKTAMAVASDQNVRSIGSTNVDIQSVYFAQSTACSSTPCAIASQVGSKITSVSFEATGVYRLNGIDGLKYVCNGSTSPVSPILNHDRANSSTSYARILARTTGSVLTNAADVSITCMGIP